MRYLFVVDRWRAALTAAFLLLVAGCSLDRHAWRPAACVAPVELTATQVLTTGLDIAERQYAQGFALEELGRAECVDYYYQSAVTAWPTLAGEGRSGEVSRGWDLYHSALTRMLDAAQHLGRWHAGRGLVVNSPSGLTPLTAVYHGFAWKPADFSELAPVGDYEAPKLKHQFKTAGLGVPRVVVRRGRSPEPFLQEVQSFAATAVLRPTFANASNSSVPAQQSTDFTLELFNPLLTDSLPTTAGCIPLARDLSAPFAYPPRGRDTNWLQEFLVPGSGTERDGLFMIEPYQPGKIPVVLIHGLLSDPLTWVNMVNELRANRQITNRYQFWGFRYSTGTQFFESATVLRRQLRRLRETYDPHRADPVLSQTVLVGHSMGGLLAKLQVVYSGDQLWRTLANRPPSQIIATPQVRDRLVEQVFFSPNPDVARVVFIGTPHQGSSDATRCIGRIGSALAEVSSEQEEEHDQLLRDNPGVFTKEVRRKIPSSIDLLEPNNSFLHATLTLPFASHVRVHSICGVVDRPFFIEASDGVVPLHSARLLEACSEVLVQSKHTNLTHDSDVISEVSRILCQHVQEVSLR